MKISRRNLERIIREELDRLAERTLPDTLEIDPEAMEFSVEAEPNRPGEVGDRRRIKGRLTPDPTRPEGEERFLPKGVEDEDYFGASMRSASGQLSAQLRDVINQQMVDSGYEAATIAAATEKISKGEVMADALTQLLSLESKLRSQRDRAALRAAVESILGIKYRFEIPEPAQEDQGDV
jgi:hypothetical protein